MDSRTLSLLHSAVAPIDGSIFKSISMAGKERIEMKIFTRSRDHLRISLRCSIKVGLLTLVAFVESIVILVAFVESIKDNGDGPSF